jgi:hypothetical protein
MGCILAVALFGCSTAEPKQEERTSDTNDAVANAAAEKSKADVQSESGLGVDAQLANPVIPAANADEVFAMTGVKIVLYSDESIGLEVGDVAWSVIGQSVAQAVFWAKDMNGVMPMGEATLSLRAMVTPGPEDISGVYDQYTNTITEKYETSAGASVSVEIRSTEEVGAVAVWYDSSTGTSWALSFTEFSTDYMTTEAVMKYLVEDVINLN